jgi:hypothetical protein
MKLDKKHLWKVFYRDCSNQKQELPVVAMFVNDQDKMSNPYREPSIDASYQVSVLTNMAATGNSCFRLVNF